MTRKPSTKQSVRSTLSTSFQGKPMTHTVPSFKKISTATRLRAFAPAYAKMAATDPVLCELPTVLDAVAFFERPALPLSRARPAVLRALVSFAQATRHVVWTELLLVAYAPMIRSFVAEDESDLEERTAEVIARFFDAVAHADVRAESITQELFVGTKTRLESAALAELEWKDVLLVPDIGIYATSEALRLWSDAEEPDVDLTPKEVDDTDLLATFGERGALTDLVDLRYAGATAGERRTIYARLAQRRARLARHVRGHKSRRFS